MTSKFNNNLVAMKKNPEDFMKNELENLMKKNPEDLIASVWVKMEDENGDVESFEDVWVSLQDNSPTEEQEPPQNNYIDDQSGTIQIRWSLEKGQPPPTQRKSLRTNYQNEQLQCFLCNYKTMHKKRFKFHMLGHDNLNRTKNIPDKKFKCTKCLYMTAYSESFKKHTRVHLKEKRYYCDKCPFKTKYQFHIHKHLTLVHKVLETNVCEFYQLTTLKKWRMKSHKQRSKKNYPLSCMHCQFQTFYRCELKNHTTMSHHREAHEKSTVTMKVCIDTTCEPTQKVNNVVLGQQIPLERTVEQITNQAVSLLKQEEEHNDSNDVEVASTDYSYNECQSIPVIDARKEKNQYQCTLCTYASESKYSVQRHCQRHHTGVKDQYKCNFCAWTTKTKDQIVLHVKRSKSNKIQYCSVCSYNTKYKCQYVNHIKEHNTFMCPSCDYSSKKKFNLSRHFSTVHLRVGFKCKYCDYVSVRKDSLLGHEAGHIRVKLGCIQCNFTTTRKGKLESHVRTTHAVDAK